MSDNAYHDLVAEKEDLACAVSTLEENKLQLQREINQLNEVAKDRQRCVDELRSKVNQLLSDVNTKEMENQVHSNTLYCRTIGYTQIHLSMCDKCINLQSCDLL